MTIVADLMLKDFVVDTDPLPKLQQYLYRIKHLQNYLLANIVHLNPLKIKSIVTSE